MNLAHDYRPRAVKPLVCMREAWQLIKDEYWLFLGITLAGLFIGSLAALFLMGPLMCGIHYCLFRKENNQRFEFSMLFKGFDYFVPSLIATLIATGPMILVFVVAYLLLIFGMFAAMAAFQPAQGQPPAPMFFVTILLLFALYFFAIFFFSGLIRMVFFFAYPLIVDRGLSGWEAVKLSARAVLGNFFGVLGLMLLIELLGLIGMFACYFGFLFVLPVTFAMSSVAYQQVFGREASDLAPDEEPDELPAPSAGPAQTGIKGKRKDDNTAVEPGIP